jgi:hypothetical protein
LLGLITKVRSETIYVSHQPYQWQNDEYLRVDGIANFNGDGTSDIALHTNSGTTRTDLVHNTHTIAVIGIDCGMSATIHGRYGH